MKYLKIFYYRVRPDMVGQHLAIQIKAKTLYQRYLSTPPIHLKSGTDANQWIELHWYESQAHAQQVAAQLASDPDQAQLWQQFQATLDLQNFTPQIHEYSVQDLPDPLNLNPTPPAAPEATPAPSAPASPAQVAVQESAQKPTQETRVEQEHTEQESPAEQENSAAVIALPASSKTEQETPVVGELIADHPTTEENNAEPQTVEEQASSTQESLTVETQSQLPEDASSAEEPSDLESSIAAEITEETEPEEAETDLEPEVADSSVNQVSDNLPEESEADDSEPDDDKPGAEESFQLGTTKSKLPFEDEQETEEEIELTLDDLDDDEDAPLDAVYEEKLVLDDEPEAEPSNHHEGNGHEQAASETELESVRKEEKFEDSDFQFAEKEDDDDDFQLPPSFTSNSDKKDLE